MYHDIPVICVLSAVTRAYLSRVSFELVSSYRLYARLHRRRCCFARHPLLKPLLIEVIYRLCQVRDWVIVLACSSHGGKRGGCSLPRIMSVQFLIRERTPLALMLYTGCMSVFALTAWRRASKILEPIVERSYEAIRQWVQRFAPPYVIGSMWTGSSSI